MIHQYEAQCSGQLFLAIEISLTIVGVWPNISKAGYGFDVLLQQSTR